MKTFIVQTNYERASSRAIGGILINRFTVPNEDGTTISVQVEEVHPADHPDHGVKVDPTHCPDCEEYGRAMDYRSQ
jgi:hypothetical protein